MSTLLNRRQRRSEGEIAAPRSSASSRRQSNAVSVGSSSDQLDDWSSSFTGLVDLDRRMRNLALAERDPIQNDGSTGSLASMSSQQHRKNSGSSRQTSSICSVTSGPSVMSSATAPSFGNFGSDGWTLASTRFSHDSLSPIETSPSLLSKRRTSHDSAMLSARLAPIPLPPFRHSRLTDAHGIHVATYGREPDTLTPMAFRNTEDVMTPGAAAAATWTDSVTPSYFAVTESSSSEKYQSGLRRVSRQAKHQLGLDNGSQSNSSEDEHNLALDLDFKSAGARDTHHDSAVPNSYAIRRSAQSLALGFRFKMMKAGRKLKRSSQGAVDHLAHSHSSERDSNDVRWSHS